MATVFKAICLDDHTMIEQDPVWGEKRLDLKRGHEYIISPEREGKVRVFSTYWAWVPASLFAGHRKLP